MIKDLQAEEVVVDKDITISVCERNTDSSATTTATTNNGRGGGVSVKSIVYTDSNGYDITCRTEETTNPSLGGGDGVFITRKSKRETRKWCNVNTGKYDLVITLSEHVKITKLPNPPSSSTSHHRCPHRRTVLRYCGHFVAGGKHTITKKVYGRKDGRECLDQMELAVFDENREPLHV